MTREKRDRERKRERQGQKQGTASIRKVGQEQRGNLAWCGLLLASRQGREKSNKLGACASCACVCVRTPATGILDKGTRGQEKRIKNIQNSTTTKSGWLGISGLPEAWGTRGWWVTDDAPLPEPSVVPNARTDECTVGCLLVRGRQAEQEGNPGGAVGASQALGSADFCCESH